MKSLRSFFTSNFFLAFVAILVFQQVWNMATGWNIVGGFMTMWLAFKLGGMAGYADVIQAHMRAEREMADMIMRLQASFDALDLRDQVAFADKQTALMGRLARAHQMMVEHCQIPYTPVKFRDVLPSPRAWLARRRQRKIMATAKVVHP